LNPFFTSLQQNCIQKEVQVLYGVVTPVSTQLLASILIFLHHNYIKKEVQVIQDLEGVVTAVSARLLGSLLPLPAPHLYLERGAGCVVTSISAKLLESLLIVLHHNNIKKEVQVVLVVVTSISARPPS